MEVSEARSLIQKANPDRKKSTWMDLGCGEGTFTYALAGLLSQESKITAIDKSFQRFERLNNGCEIIFEQADFEQLSLTSYYPDGILMANSLHYVRDQLSFIKRLKIALNANGKILLVEYDTDVPNQWVPNPIGFRFAKTLFQAAGFSEIQLLGERKSIYRKEKIYACCIQ